MKYLKRVALVRCSSHCIAVAAVAGLLLGCYHAPRWSDSGPAEFSARSTETVAWGKQLVVTELDLEQHFGVAVHEVPLCREIAAGEARQPQSGGAPL